LSTCRPRRAAGTTLFTPENFDAQLAFLSYVLDGSSFGTATGNDIMANLVLSLSKRRNTSNPLDKPRRSSFAQLEQLLLLSASPIAEYDSQLIESEVTDLTCDCDTAVPDPFSVKLDLGTSSSPVAEGSELVTSSTTYSTELGYGWTSGTIDERDRGDHSGDELTRDFNFTALGTFSIDLSAESGTYDVTISMGDGMFFTPTREDMGIYLEGELVDTVTTQPGEYITSTYRVTASDGQLNFMFEDLGGTGQFVIINSIEVNAVEIPDPDTGDDVQLHPSDSGIDTALAKLDSSAPWSKAVPFTSKLDFGTRTWYSQSGLKLGVPFSEITANIGVNFVEVLDHGISDDVQGHRGDDIETAGNDVLDHDNADKKGKQRGDDGHKGTRS
jgi:hypothetical protein